MITPADILNDFSASYWLKNALKTALERDPVDAAHDAEVLADTLKRRMNKTLTDSMFKTYNPPTQLQR